MRLYPDDWQRIGTASVVLVVGILGVILARLDHRRRLRKRSSKLKELAASRGFDFADCGIRIANRAMKSTHLMLGVRHQFTNHLIAGRPGLRSEYADGVMKAGSGIIKRPEVFSIFLFQLPSLGKTSFYATNHRILRTFASLLGAPVITVRNQPEFHRIWTIKSEYPSIASALEDPSVSDAFINLGRTRKLNISFIDGDMLIYTNEPIPTAQIDAILNHGGQLRDAIERRLSSIAA